MHQNAEIRLEGTKAILIECADQEAQAEYVANRVAKHIEDALFANDRAGIVVPGGRTPAPVFKRLANCAVEWSRVSVVLSDDRWVGADHNASNTGMLHQNLLDALGGSANFVALYGGEPSAAEGIPAAEARLAGMPHPFACTLLGMGEDGHIASLFPRACSVEQYLDRAGTERVAAITPDPLPANAPYERMTLTMAALLDSREVMLLIRGADKRMTLSKAIDGTDTAEMPVRAILHQSETPVRVVWAP